MEGSRGLTEGLRDKTIGSSLGSFGATDESVQWGSTGAVGEADGTSKLNQVTGSDVVGGKERSESVDTVRNTEVGMEIGLDVGELDLRTVGTTATAIDHLVILKIGIV